MIAEVERGEPVYPHGIVEIEFYARVTQGPDILAVDVRADPVGNHSHINSRAGALGKRSDESIAHSAGIPEVVLKRHRIGCGGDRLNHGGEHVAILEARDVVAIQERRAGESGQGMTERRVRHGDVHGDPASHFQPGPPASCQD